MDADERYSSVAMGAWETSQQKSINTERNCDEGVVANLLGNLRWLVSCGCVSELDWGDDDEVAASRGGDDLNDPKESRALEMMGVEVPYKIPSLPGTATSINSLMLLILS